MTFDAHCRECSEKLGAPFPEVHRWLDEFFGVVGPKHRKYRHHLKGIKECGKLFGPRAEEAAMLHVISDLRTGEGWKDGERFPKDEEDYVRIGFF